MNEFVNEISRRIPCREQQIGELYNLIGHSDETMPYSIFISGNTSTGKSCCIETILEYLNYKSVIINCIECYAAHIIYETILSNLFERFEIEEKPTKCDTMKDFLHNMQLLSEHDLNNEPVIIVFDKAERLRGQDALMSVFVRLKEFLQLNVCSIFVTDLVYENFYYKMGIYEPIKMYFPNYTKEELFKIIFLCQTPYTNYVIYKNKLNAELQDEISKPELFGNFLNAFLSVFYRPCRDLIELKYMARINFVKYCEPIVKKEINSGDLPKLWRHIAPILKTSLELLYLRVHNTLLPDDSEDKQLSGINIKNIERTLTNELTSTKTFAQSFELPYYAKYLLIAAYLASYNPQKADKRLFLKNHGKQRKNMKQVKAKARINERLNTQLGPKQFTLDRLLAIFYAILEEKIGLTSNLLCQISSLVELKLLLGPKDVDLYSSKYKCIVSFDFINAISQAVGFNIRKYLFDFI